MQNRFVESAMGMRNPREKNSWIPLPFANFQIDKPTIICLPGGGCVRSKLANGFCKFASYLLGFRENESDLINLYDYIDIVGFSYGKDSQSLASRFTEEESKMIADNILLPLCEDENGNLTHIKSAQKKFANITFFTFCQGSKELMKILIYLEQGLMKKGYSKEDVKRLFASLMHITYAPESRIEYLKTISFCSLQDGILFKFKEIYNEKFGDKLNGIDIVFQPKNTTLNFEAKADCVNVFSSKLNNNLLFDYDEHTFRYLSRDINWRHVGRTGISSPNADCVSQMMAYALASAVESSLKNNESAEYVSRPTAEKFMESLESIKSSFEPEELGVESREF